MSDQVQGELLLACPKCWRAVTVTYYPGHHAQGLVNLDENRICHQCGNEMVETERDEDGRIVVPERVTDATA